ncbi:MAG TPA: MFS transporter [Chloroflexota bacterium]|nr:MFS transporter [Chloroflexota bacterium]
MKASSLGALAHRDFRLLWSGLVVSAVGSWVQDVADGWLLLQMTNSPLLVGLKGAFTAIPFITASFLAGALADRLNRRLLVACAQSAYVLAATAEGMLVFTGHIQVWQIYVFGSINWSIAAIDAAARQALVPALVPREDLSSAIALMSSLRRGSSIIGPVIGGLTVATIGIGAAYFVNAFSFVPVVIAALALRARPVVPKAAAESLARSMLSGLRYSVAHAVIGGLLVVEAGQSLFQPIITLMPVFARDVLHVGPDSYGLMLSMMGLGALTATFSLVLLGSRVVQGRYAIAAAAIYPAVLIAFATSRNFHLALACLLLLGMADILGGTLRNTIIQIQVEEGYRGRIMGLLSTANRGTSGLGAVPIGALAVPLGAPLAMSLGGVMAFATAALVTLRIPQILSFTATGYKVQQAETAAALETGLPAPVEASI